MINCKFILVGLSLIVISCATKKPYQVVWERGGLDGLEQSAASTAAATPVLSTVRNRPALILGTRGGSLLALELKSGTVLWRSQHQGIFEAPGKLSGDQFFIGDLEGHVHAVKTQTGKEIWHVSLGSQVISTPEVIEDLVLVAISDNSVIALDKKNGKVVWRYREDPATNVTIHGLSGPVANHDKVGGKVWVGLSNGALVCLNLSDGQMLWRVRLSQEGHPNDVDTTPLLIGEVIVAAGVNGPVAAYNHQGKLLWWQDKLQTTATAIPASDSMGLLVATLAGKLYRLNIADGSVLWESQFSPAATSPIKPAIVGEHVIVGSSQGDLAVLRESDGKLLWHYQLGKLVIGQILPVADGFVAMNDDQRLFRFRNRRSK